MLVNLNHIFYIILLSKNSNHSNQFTMKLFDTGYTSDLIFHSIYLINETSFDDLF